LIPFQLDFLFLSSLQDNYRNGLNAILLGQLWILTDIHFYRNEPSFRLGDDLGSFKGHRIEFFTVPSPRAPEIDQEGFFLLFRFFLAFSRESSQVMPFRPNKPLGAWTGGR